LKTKIRRGKKKEKQGKSGALWKQKEISYSLNIRIYYTNINGEKFHLFEITWTYELFII